MSNRQPYSRLAQQDNSEELSDAENPEEEAKSDSDDGTYGDLQEDVYGAALFSVVFFYRYSGTSGDRQSLDIVRVVFVVMLLILNSVLQCGILLCSFSHVVVPAVTNVQKLYRDYHAYCFDVDGVYDEEMCKEWPDTSHDKLCALAIAHTPVLHLLILVWWMRVLIAFRETDLNWRRIYTLPSVNNTNTDCVKTGVTGDTIIYRTSFGVRWLLFAVIFIPKHVINLALMITGTWWLTAAASLQDLILNLLSLGFVIELDELAYGAFLPGVLKQEMREVKLSFGRRFRAKERRHVGEYNKAIKTFPQFRDQLRREKQLTDDEIQTRWKRCLPSEEWMQDQVKATEQTQNNAKESYIRSTIYMVVLFFGSYLYTSVLQNLPFIGVLPGYLNDLQCASYWTMQWRTICNSWAIWEGARCFPFGISESQEGLPQAPEVYPPAYLKPVARRLLQNWFGDDGFG